MRNRLSQNSTENLLLNLEQIIRFITNFIAFRNSLVLSTHKLECKLVFS